MNNLVKGSFAVAVATHAQFVSAINIKSTQTTTTGDNGTDGNFIDTLDTMLGYLIGLLYFVAVVFALYGGFQILTAGGDEEKVKKGKTTLIQAVIGLVVIFLASQIVNWIIGLSTSVIK
jgi:type IV secretory pathway VirB2 component (pilin)